MTTTLTTQEVIADIRTRHRERRFAMNVRQKVDNAILSYLRGQLGWRPDLPKDESDYIKAAAMAALKAAEDAARARSKGEPHVIADAVYANNRDAIDMAIAGRVPFDLFESENELAMKKLVRQLPIWKSWGKSTSGVAEKTLGMIIGEAGDLNNYPTIAKLWKRLGLGVIDGARQGNPGKDATKEDWIRHGYSGERRSILFNFSSAIIKNGGPYRDIYDRIKAEEKAKAEARGLTVLPAADINKLVRKGADKTKYMSIGHIDKRSRRRTEKLFLKHLLREWKAAAGVEAGKTKNCVSDKGRGIPVRPASDHSHLHERAVA